MSRKPEEFRKIATHCRFLASSCVTAEARRPLDEMAEEFEREVDEQQRVAHTPIGSGRY